jgi:hypothetical protein
MFVCAFTNEVNAKNAANVSVKVDLFIKARNFDIKKEVAKRGKN